MSKVKLSRRVFFRLILASAVGVVAYKKIRNDKVSSGDDFYGGANAYLEKYALQLKGLKFNSDKTLEVKQLEEKLYSRNWSNVDSVKKFTTRLNEIISVDFSEGRTVNFNGWILSEFEKDMVMYALYLKEKNGVLIENDSVTFESAKLHDFLDIKGWGPQSTCQGMAFNQQSDGHSSQYFFTGPYNGTLRVYLNGSPLPTTKGAEFISTKVGDEMFEKHITTAGLLEVMIYDPARGVKQKVGLFEVYSKSASALLSNGKKSKSFGAIKKWGPQTLLLPQLHDFDKHPLWIETRCAPRDSVIMVGETPLKTTVGTTLVTGVFPDMDLPVPLGEYTVQLFSSSSNESVVVGKIVLGW